MALITGIEGKSEVQLEVDRTFLAARIAARPLDYASEGRVLGHYAVAQRSGELAATIGALGHLAAIRWADSTAYCVLMRVKAGWSISAADAASSSPPATSTAGWPRRGITGRWESS